MTREQAISANIAKGKAAKEQFKKFNYEINGKNEYKERFVGNHKNHIQKLKKIFNNAKFGLKNYNQPDKVVHRFVFYVPSN